MDMHEIGPYRVVRRLGRGGMGTVYEGVHIETGHHVALKVLASPLIHEEDFRERFGAEIEALRKLRHPGIVQLLGFGEQDEHLFYAMEFVDGPSLEDVLAGGHRFPWREVVQIGIELCLALRHAHDRGIVHRDIKPGNLLRGPDDHVKISDFGIARLFGQNRITSAGSVLGTAEYMSPEQAEGRPVDQRSDLYSLGEVLYALLTGHPPFQAHSVPEVLQMQRFSEHEPVRCLVPEVPPPLEGIIDQLLAKEPSERPANASVVGKRLQSLLEPPVVSATIPGGKPTSIVLPPTINPGVESSAAVPVPEQPPTTEGTFDEVRVPPDASLAATRVTAAFYHPPPSDVPAGSPSNSPPAVASQRSAGTAGESGPEGGERPRGARFVPVRREELDPPSPDRSRSPISLNTALLALGLVAMGGVFWYLLQPLSADALYERIAQHVNRQDVRALADAEDDINDFLMRFPDDPRAKWLREQQEELELDRLERKFERRAAGLIRSESLAPIEQAYLEAIQYARIDPDRGLARLRAILDLYAQPADASTPLARCLELTRRRLRHLSARIDEQAHDQAAAVDERLRVAEGLLSTDPNRARGMCRAIVELYRDKPWAAPSVRAAEQLLRGQGLPGENLPRNPHSLPGRSNNIESNAGSAIGAHPQPDNHSTRPALPSTSSREQ